MKISRTTLRAFWLAVALHVAIGLLLVAGLEFSPEVAVQPHMDVDIVEATSVDSARVEQELEKFREEDRREQEQRRQQEEEMTRRAEETQRKAAEAEQRRKTEEQRLAELQQKKKEEEKARETEQKRLAELKKQQEEVERQRKLEEEKKQKAAAEAERLRKEAEERKRAEEEARQRKLAEEKQRKEAEEAMRRQLAEEEARNRAEQDRRDAGIINEYAGRIKIAIQREFNTAGLPPGLSCTLRIRMVPGGEVVSVQIAKSSGSTIFDRRAEVAVSKASPLPVPDEARLFERFREINFIFAPTY